MSTAQIQEVTLPYNTPATAQLPATATLIDALEYGSNQGVGVAMQCSLLFEVPDGDTPIGRTFRAFKRGDTIDLSVWEATGYGWFQRTGTGIVTRYAVYEQR